MVKSNIEKLFDVLDADKTGEIEPGEFVNLMHVAGIGGIHADAEAAKQFYISEGCVEFSVYLSVSLSLCLSVWLIEII